MSNKQITGVFGFAVVAVWRFAGFDTALMCTLGALAGVVGVLFLEGQVEFTEIRRRFSSRPHRLAAEKPEAGERYSPQELLPPA